MHCGRATCQQREWQSNQKCVTDNFDGKNPGWFACGPAPNSRQGNNQIVHSQVRDHSVNQTTRHGVTKHQGQYKTAQVINGGDTRGDNKMQKNAKEEGLQTAFDCCWSTKDPSSHRLKNALGWYFE